MNDFKGLADADVGGPHERLVAFDEELTPPSVFQFRYPCRYPEPHQPWQSDQWSIDL